MAARQIFFNYKLHHLVFWLLLGGLWFYLRYQDYSTLEKALLVTIVKVLDLAIMVYVANRIFIPRLLYQKKYSVFAILLLLMILLSSISKMYIIGYILNAPGLYQWSSNLKGRIYDNVLPHIFLVIAGMALKLLADYNNMQKRLLQVAKEKAEAELNFLKAQINPHFLFNSLNSVYFLIDKNNNEARQALHTFSGMLRYQLYEASSEKSPIEKEIGYLKDYIQLQQLRNENCRVNMQVDSTAKGFSIEPFLLLPFVENSFKHLSHFGNGQTPNEVQISLAKRNGEMEFHVSNTLEAEATKEDGGIGLRNVRRRLELLYPQKHRLQINNKEGWFDVNLKLKLDNQ